MTEVKRERQPECLSSCQTAEWDWKWFCYHDNSPRVAAAQISINKSTFKKNIKRTQTCSSHGGEQFMGAKWGIEDGYRTTNQTPNADWTSLVCLAEVPLTPLPRLQLHAM